MTCTKRQREILDYIDHYISKNRHSPSYREIQAHFGFSSLGSVYNHIQALKKKGILSGEEHHARALKVAKEAKHVEVPLIGKVRGGMPIETFSQVWMHPLPEQMVPAEGECYLLQVEGAELSEENIQGGDLLLVQPCTSLDDGEMGIVLAGEHTTLVKRVYWEEPHYRLASENPNVEPLILQKAYVTIQGKVVTLFRTYAST